MENKKQILSMQLNVDDFAPASDSEKESLSVMRESVSFWKDGLRRLRKNPIAMVSLAVLIIVLILAFIVPAFYPYDYATQIRGSENLGPMQYSEAEQAAMAARTVGFFGAGIIIVAGGLLWLRARAAEAKRASAAPNGARAETGLPAEMPATLRKRCSRPR